MEVLIPNPGIGKVAVQLAAKTPRKRLKLRTIIKNFPEVQNNKRCLDIGTSHGGLAYYFSKKGNWCFVDSNQNNLDVASTILNGEFYCQDALSFFKSFNGFSLITCFDTIMYFDNPDELLKLFFNALLQDGHILVTGTEGDRHNLLIRVREHLGLEKAHQFKIQITGLEMIELLKTAGFTIMVYAPFCGFFTELLQTILDYITSKNRAGQKGLVPDLVENDGQRLPKYWQLCVINYLSIFCQAIDFLLPVNPKYGYLITARKSFDKRVNNNLG